MKQSCLVFILCYIFILFLNYHTWILKFKYIGNQFTIFGTKLTVSLIGNTKVIEEGMALEILSIDFSELFIDGE